MASYRTKAGDTVDWICWRYYGTIAEGAVEMLLESNRRLAESGPILPAGLVVELPRIEAPEKTSEVRLWD